MSFSRTKIVASNEAKLQAVLDAVQKNCSVNVFDVQRLINVASFAESRLHGLGISKAARAGARFVRRDAGPDARAYKYAQGATEIVIERGFSAWYLVDVKRVDVYPCQLSLCQLLVTPEQQQIAICKLCATFDVQDAVAA